MPSTHWIELIFCVSKAKSMGGTNTTKSQESVNYYFKPRERVRVLARVRVREGEFPTLSQEVGLPSSPFRVPKLHSFRLVHPSILDYSAIRHRIYNILYCTEVICSCAPPA